MTMGSEWEFVLTEFTEAYCRAIEKSLPETDKNNLLSFHGEFKKQAIERFLEGTENLSADASFLDAVEEKFLEVLDLNWQKCESFCREVLSKLGASMNSSSTSLQSKTDGCQNQWWNRVKNLQKKYADCVGDTLNFLMPHIWLEYLNERQELDFKVLMGDIELEREKIEELENGETIASPSPPAADEEYGYQPLPTEVDPISQHDAYTDFSLETTEKQLHLQMTWGRILVFWKYWIECRKDTLEVLGKLLDVIESCEKHDEENYSVFGLPSETLDGDKRGQLMYQNILQDISSRNFVLEFANIISKDFATFNCLIKKLRDFFDKTLLPEYVCTLDMNPANIFQRISTFQADMSMESSDNGQFFQACATFLESEEDGSNVIGRIFKNNSKPVLHLKTFLEEISLRTLPEVQVSVAVQQFLSQLTEEESNMSTMLSDSIDSLLTVASNITDAIPQLRRDIVQWSPARDETVSQLRTIAEKLHKTTKKVAITQTVSSSIGIVGGVIAIGGLIMAPFTLGASLIPTAIAGGVVSGVGAATAIGATVTEIIIDKDEMKKAVSCLQQDKILFQDVADQINFLNLNSTLLLRYIPQDELQSFMSIITDPKSTAMRSLSSTTQVKQQIAINVARLVSVGGKALMLPISRMVLAGTIAASRVALLALVHSIAAVGVALDIANLVVAGAKLGKGAKSQSAEKLEGVIEKLEEERRIIENCLNDINLEL